MDWKDRIEINPKVLVGKPVIRGTRISVDLVLQMIAAGVSEAEILDNYPSLSPDDLRASVATASLFGVAPDSELSEDDYRQYLEEKHR